MRHDMRARDELRAIDIQPGFTKTAAGSALIACGGTRVLCTASVQNDVPPFLRGSGRGWVTAEYAMLPGSTPQRKQREFLKRDGRSVEIQRLIGRSLRSVCRLEALGERTIYIDCDVIEADGGTRTASITGAFVALTLACKKLLDAGDIIDSPIRQQVAAVSVGVSGGEPVLDLDYPEDSHAAVDMNIIMADNGDIIELQGTGEQRPFSRAELGSLMELAESGIRQLMQAQREALGDAAAIIGAKPVLALATNNAHKTTELKAMLGDMFDVRTMRELGIDCEPEETGATFEENALIKARALMALTHCASLADDSGLEVDALNGQPGVYSARFCGQHGDDHANNQKLKGLMADITDRGCGFASAVALCRPGREDVVARGVCRGQLLYEERGTGGFGYDPLFLSDELGKTFAEADADEKNRVSHRARAVEALRAKLEQEQAQ